MRGCYTFDELHGVLIADAQRFADLTLQTPDGVRTSILSSKVAALAELVRLLERRG